MNILMIIFVVWKLLVQLSFVFSYTVVLKPVKHLKVYRYELRHPKVVSDAGAQFIYPVSVKPVPGQRLYPVVVNPNFRARTLVKKDKKKFAVKTSSTEKPNPRDHRLLGLPQQLVPPLSNQIEEYSEGKPEESREPDNDIRPLVPLQLPQDDKSFPSFGQEKGRIYNKPGEWAVPSPTTDSENTTKPSFTPSQLYLQVRHRNTVIHVPQTEALKDAETLEELINAPRLKELARTTHVQEVYSEEGYEDAGYDHAGQIRHAQHGEVYDAKDEGRFRIKEPPIIIDYDSDLEESRKTSLNNANRKIKGTAGNNDENEKLESRITRSQTEANKTSIEFAKTPRNYKGEHIYSSRVKAPINFEGQDGKGLNLSKNTEQTSFPSYFDKMPPPPENIFANVFVPPLNQTGKKSAKYRKEELNSTKIYPISQTRVPEAPTAQANTFTDFKPYLSIIDSQASPSAKSLKYSRIYSKKTKQLKLEPYKTGNIYQPPPPPPPPPPSQMLSPLVPPSRDDLPRDLPNEDESINQRIVLPTIGYINSLTTAHFGKGSTSSPVQEDSKPHLTSTLNLTQALNYLRFNKNLKSPEVTEPPTETDVRTFEPMKLKKSRFNSGKTLNKTKRDVYLIKEQNKESEENQTEDYEGNDDSDEPHNEKNEEIAEDERKRIEEENREKEKYEKDLREEISNKEKEILRETFKNIGVEKDVSEVFPEFPSSGYESESEDYSDAEDTRKPVDPAKYPYYFSKRLPENSALRYATDQQKFPRKSGFKMEFYESREEVIQCPDFHPDLDDLPTSNSTEYSEDQSGDNQRLAGVGDKIMCLRSKYFDPEPFDNPIFKEKEVEYVGKYLKKNKLSQHKSSETKNIPKNASVVEEAKTDSTHAEQKIKKATSFPYTITIQYQIPDQSTKSGSQKFSDNKQEYSLPSTAFKNPNHKVTLKQNSHLTKNEKTTSFPWKTPETSLRNLQKVNQIQTNKNVVSKTVTSPKKIYLPFNCMNIIGKLEALDGTKNVIVFCKDAVLVQEIKDNGARLQIIPKELGTSKKIKWNLKLDQDKFSSQTDWVPIVGYVLPKARKAGLRPANRKTDEVTIVKNGTSSNMSSDHFVIDELKEDEKVRQGEVVEDTNHYLKLMKTETLEKTTTESEMLTKNRKKRETETELNKFKQKSILFEEPDLEKGNSDLEKQFPEIKRVARSPQNGQNEAVSSRPFEHKRTLTRLSGLDFLTRYHKNKGKANGREKTSDFWKVSNQPEDKKPSKPAQAERPLINTTPLPKTSELRRPTTPTALTTEKYSSKPSTKKANEFRKISPLNLIPEKITKKPDKKASDAVKISDANSEKSPTTTESHNLTRIIMKVSKETSQSSEKPRIVQVKTGDSKTRSEEKGSGNSKPETLQYKTISRQSSSAQKSEPEEEMSRYIDSTDGPTLYYVVDGRTGRGRWITNYEETRSTGKLLKNRKRNLRSRNEKRRRKQKN